MILAHLVHAVYHIPMKNLLERQRPELLLQFDIQSFPPDSNRLIDFLESLIGLGYTGVLLDFGAMFPWSLDDRFRSEEAYAEEVIGGLHEVAAKAGFEIIPVFDFFSSIDYVLCEPSYSHLMIRNSSPALLDPMAPGARGFVEALFEDMTSLLRGTKHIRLGGKTVLRNMVCENRMENFLSVFQSAHAVFQRKRLCAHD